MKKSKKLLIKIGLIFISLCFLCILCNNSVEAATITTGDNLWDKTSNGLDCYCIEPGITFVPGTYTIDETWQVGSDDDGNDYVKKNGSITTNSENKKFARSRGYVLAQTEDSFAPLGIANDSWGGDAHIINNGIYNVLSYKQEALWMLQNDNRYWDEYGSNLTYHWNSKMFNIQRTGYEVINDTGEIEEHYYYKFTKPDSDNKYNDKDATELNTYSLEYNGKEIDKYAFGNGKDYWKKAYKLYNEADKFANNYESKAKCIGDKALDYTNSDYVVIGTYRIEYSDNITFDKNSFTATDKSNNDITNSVVLDWIDDNNVIIKVDKNNMPSSFKEITFNYTKESLEATIYICKIAVFQNLMVGEGALTTKTCTLTKEINADLIPAVQVKLKKVDTEGDAVCGAVFKIEYNNGLPSSEMDTLSDGTRTFLKVQPTSPDSFTATITETETPEGYKPLAKPIQLKFTFNSSTVNWEVEKIDGPEETTTIGTIDKNTRTNTCIVPITVVNKSIIEKLTILKTSSIKKLGALEGAKFKLTLSNVANVKNYKIPTTGATQEAPKTIYVTTDSNGNIVLEDIEIANLSEYVVITIEEIEAPVGYKKIEGKITLTLKRTGDHYTEFKQELDDTINISKSDHYIPDSKREFSKLIFDDYNHTLEVDLFNIPIMNLGGIVWYEDEKTGKKPSGSDIYGDGNGEEALSGIKVYLYEGNNKIAETTSSDGTQTATYTNHKGEKITVNLEKGQYMFTDVTAGEHYHMEFEYDGITYEAITNYKNDILYKKNGQSKISTEINGRELKNGTTTISGTESESQSKTNGGYIIDYELEDNEKIPDKAVYSQISKDGKQVFVTAKSTKYLQKIEDWRDTWKDNGEINLDSYAFDINCGLCKKFFDLNLGTDVASAKVQINGQTSTYNYDQILDGMLDDYLEKVYRTTDSIVDYNLYLAHSDYNYRIEDYKVPGTDGSIANNYDIDSEHKIDQDKIDSTKGTEDDRKSELQVYVTYILQINNQSTQHNATVNKVKYSYDEGYEFVSSDGNVTDNNTEKRELLIEDIPVPVKYKPEITLTFKVRKNDDGTFVKEPSDTSKYTNKAEIIEYTTAGRLVDADSAPGNTFLGENKATERCEDDTDTANGIVISFKKEAERSISGYVFKDTNYDGVQNGLKDEEYINDVIVQLIELVEINNKQYEYIWQETVTGSNTVKTTARNGYTGPTYNVSNDEGEYKFTERIIPGNYIVRFIYGDGTYFDTNINGKEAIEETKKNIKKYNGEDYKSAYAVYKYDADWYNKSAANSLKRSSKAVDNEARRLRVMSYAVDVDETKGEALALLDKNIGTNDEELKKVLSNTWMCAETQKIKMPVDSDNKENTSDTTTIDDGSNPSIEYTQFNNVNFGLMERPKTKLVLEKHITGLTIKPVASGVGLIANATADINKIVEATAGEPIELAGQQDGLFAIKSGREERGQWYLQTDTTELAQGADAYITYTYVIKNEGDEDYLSEELINAYRNNGGTVNDTTYDSYKEYLDALEDYVKDEIKSKQFTKGTYLTEAYYKKNVTLPDTQKVLASVEQIQEALNPKVSFVNSTTDFSIIKDSEGEVLVENKNVYKEEGTGTKEEEIKEQIESVGESVGGTKKLLQTGKTLSDIKQNKEEFIEKTMDTSKKLVVSVGLSASEIENGGVYDSYIAQITHYTNAAGRRDQSSTPANLSYVHSYDTDITLENYNEEDEFWAERFIITKPTGEDKLTAVQIAIISVSAVVILGVGIILIKKFVLKK